MKKVLSLILAGSLALSVLAACGGTKATSGTASGSAVTSGDAPVAAGGKILRIATEDPMVALDMQANTYSLIMKVTDNVVESLMTTVKDGELEPTLITKLPDLSEDMLTYSFELKEGVKFHDGSVLTADDVKYSLERMVKLEVMGSLMGFVEGYEAFAAGEAEEITGIKVVDDTHFTIQMVSVYVPFPSVLSTPYCAIYPREACEAAGEEWGKSTLIGTGPFTFGGYNPGVGVELTRYDDFHGTVAKLDGISYKFVDDPNTQVLEYQKGNVDFIDLHSTLYPVYSADPVLNEELHTYTPIGGYFMTMNVKTISDPKVREAISLSIDRVSICESLMHGTAAPATSFLPEGLIGHDPTLEIFEYNPEKAKKLLEEAGYADGYDLRVSVNTKYPLTLSFATAFQEQAKASNINVEIEQVDSAAWLDMKRSGGVDAGVGNWYVDYIDPDSMLYPMSDARTDNSSSFWHNDRFKTLMEEGIQTTDTAERQTIYEEAEKILTREDFAASPIYNESKFCLIKPNVSGIEMNSTFRYFFQNADIT